MTLLKSPFLGRPSWYVFTKDFGQLQSFSFKESTMNIRKQAPTSLSCALIAALLLLAVGGFKSAQAQTSTERERARTMLQTMKEDIKKNYYDPNFHGMALEARIGA